MSQKKEIKTGVKNKLAPRTQDEIDQLDLSRFNPMATTKAYEERIQYIETRGISTENLRAEKNLIILRNIKQTLKTLLVWLKSLWV